MRAHLELPPGAPAKEYGPTLLSMLHEAAFDSGGASASECKRAVGRPRVRRRVAPLL
jgi:hypothetical protein